MNKKINSNGFGYIDLGLPSGTLWATSNVGASKPSDYGLYFQLGDTVGCTSEQVGEGEGQKKFASDYSDYNWYSDGKFTKYATEGDKLNLKDDAAHVNMGGDWHIPSPEQIKELIDNTTSEWITMDGVNGRRFTSKNGKSIFIPATGFAWGGSVYGSGSGGFVWSSMLNTNYVRSGQSLGFNSGDVYLYCYGRNNGFSVRGVIDKNDKNMNLSELIKNEIKKNFKVKVSADYGGYVNVELLYDDEVISSDVCQVITDFNSLDE